MSLDWWQLALFVFVLPIVIVAGISALFIGSFGIKQLFRKVSDYEGTLILTNRDSNERTIQKLWNRYNKYGTDNRDVNRKLLALFIQHPNTSKQVKYRANQILTFINRIINWMLGLLELYSNFVFRLDFIPIGF